MCSVDSNRRFANGKWNYTEHEDSTRPHQSAGPINEDPQSGHAHDQYAFDLNTGVISNPQKNMPNPLIEARNLADRALSSGKTTNLIDRMSEGAKKRF